MRDARPGRPTPLSAPARLPASALPLLPSPALPCAQGTTVPGVLYVFWALRAEVACTDPRGPRAPWAPIPVVAGQRVGGLRAHGHVHLCPGPKDRTGGRVWGGSDAPAVWEPRLQCPLVASPRSWRL